MSTALATAIEMAAGIESIRLGNCGPSDDPGKQYAYTAAFRDVAVRFVAAVKRIGDPDLSELVADLDVNPRGIVDAHDLRAALQVAIDALREAAEDPNYASNVTSNAAFLHMDALASLKQISGSRFDVKKLVKMCEELNDAYSRGNYISAVLLLRAIMNHVPPVFGTRTFAEAVANSGRSIKAILARLEDDARPIADLHTHILMRSTEQLPTKHQIEPYKPAFELLIQEIVTRLGGESEAPA